MGASYSNTAFDYNKDDIGIDPDTKTKFVPNQKELELFKKEKMNLYKGTWTVCFIYGISALILLITVLFTETGRTYIYDKYLPAVITYVLGAIVIIIYLVYSIFNIKPRKLGKVERVDHSCPDYWKYVKEDDHLKKSDIISNINRYSFSDTSDPSCNTDPPSKDCKNTGANRQHILTGEKDPVINIDTSNIFLNYKCVPDTYIYGDKNNYHSILNNTVKNTYLKKDDIIYTELLGDKDIDKLQKYAQVTGAYKNNFISTSNLFATSSNLITYTPDSTVRNESSKTPLICNELYPSLIAKLEKDADDNTVRCAYAKKCGISWSDIDCYNNTY